MGRVRSRGDQPMRLENVPQRLKVLFLTNIPSPYRVDFFNELGTQCDLTVLYERRVVSKRDSSWAGDHATAFTEVFLPGIRVAADTALFPAVVKHLCDESLDVILVSMYSTLTGMLAVVTLRARRIPFILAGKNRTSIRGVKRWFVGATPAWLSVGKTTSEYLAHYRARCEGLQGYLLPLVEAVDDGAAERTKDSSTTFGIVEQYRFVAVGRFVFGKGHDFLDWASIKFNCDLGIYIIGSEQIGEHSCLWAKRSATNVSVIGPASGAEPRNYYRPGDPIVCPMGRGIWGSVVNEAPHRGFRIVTTDRGRARVEIVRDGANGWSVFADDPVVLTVMIGLILTFCEMLRMTCVNKSMASQYIIERTALGYLKVFRKVH